MSILKAPPKQPKNGTLQLRVDEELKAKLDKYAEFLGSTESYVVSEALKLIFNKDAEFKEWLERHQVNGRESSEDQAPANTPKEKPQSPLGHPLPIPMATGYSDNCPSSHALALWTKKFTR